MIQPPDLDISAENKAILAELMDAHGYDGLKKTQAFAFENGILNDGNDLLIAETGNGKTLTAEGVVKKHLNQGNRVAYLVPSVQLVWAKKESLQEWAGDDYSVYSGHGKYRTADIAVGTFDSFYQAILQGAEGARSLDAIILDDFHELYSDFRGTAIELSISAALYEDIDIYGISATLGNPDELGEWMNADAHISPEDRQIPIKEYAVDASTSSTKEKIIDVIKQNPDKGPYLVFCFAKSWTESRAKGLAEADLFDGPSDRNLRKELSDRVDGMLTETHREILEMLRAGVAYIHADLPGSVKQYILELYEEGELQALTTTTSLAYGFDSPVQSVIVADITRRGEYVGVYEYVQWAGRAARPRFDYPCGHCFVLTDSPDETAEQFFEPHRELEDVQTHIDDEGEFRWLVLELIANGWSSTYELEDFIKHTLYYEQMNEESAWGQSPKPKDERLKERLEETTQWLADEGFINESDTWDAFDTTALGKGAVEFKFNSFVNASLISIKSFYNWAEETDHEDIRQLDYLHRTIANFDVQLAVSTVDGPLESVIRNHGYDLDEPGITAGVIRWYWMRNYSTEEIEEQAGIDPTYLPGLASKLSDTLRATKYVIEAAPNARLPEWHESLVYRADKGVCEDAVPVVSEINAMGRARIRFLRTYLEQMARQTLDISPDSDLWELLVAFREHCGNDDKFEDVLKEQVAMVGKVTARNISAFVEDANVSETDLATDEEHALSVDTTGGSRTSGVSFSPESTRPTSLRDF